MQAYQLRDHIGLGNNAALHAGATWLLETDTSAAICWAGIVFLPQALLLLHKRVVSATWATVSVVQGLGFCHNCASAT